MSKPDDPDQRAGYAYDPLALSVRRCRRAHFPARANLRPSDHGRPEGGRNYIVLLGHSAMRPHALTEARMFLRARILGLAARARRLARIDYNSVGIRPQDLPYAPSPAHFQAANDRLASIDKQVAARLATVEREWRRAPYQRVMIDIALVEREIDRARRAFGMFYEVFSQRGASFAPELAAHDVIAQDCYDAVRQQAPRLLDSNALAPISYMEHGYSPATKRRGVVLARLLGETNPFPMIRVPWDRDNPWDPVFLHELAHNLQADMRIWQENRTRWPGAC